MSNPVGAQRYGLGGGDAYYDAVKYGGYTGTREQFGRDQAEFAQNATAVAEAREEVERNTQTVVNTAQTFTEETVPAAIQSVEEKADTEEDRLELRTTELVEAVNTAGAVQVQAVRDEGTTQIGLVSGAGTAQVEAVEQAGSDQVGVVEAAGSDQIEAVEEAGTAQIGGITSAGETQTQAVEDKGAEVIGSIPTEYTLLTKQVDDTNNVIGYRKDIVTDIRNGTLANAANTKAVYTGEYIKVAPGWKATIHINKELQAEDDHYSFGYDTYDENKNLLSRTDYSNTTTKNYVNLVSAYYIRFVIAEYTSAGVAQTLRANQFTEGDVVVEVESYSSHSNDIEFLKENYISDSNDEAIWAAGGIGSNGENYNRSGSIRMRYALSLEKLYEITVSEETTGYIDLLTKIPTTYTTGYTTPIHVARISLRGYNAKQLESSYPTAKAFRIEIMSVNSDLSECIRVGLLYAQENKSWLDNYTHQKQMADVFKLHRTGSETYAECEFKAMIIADVHHETTRFQNLVTLMSEWGTEYFDALINCGDTVLTLNSDTMTWHDSLLPNIEVPYINVIGNHDAYSTLGNLGNKSDAYNKIIVPIEGQTGMVQPEDAGTNSLCYYYFDLGTDMRVIALDCIYWDSAEESWFASVLSDALANNKAVICVSHYGFHTNQMTAIPSLWREIPGISSDGISINAASKVKDFIDAGGTFICWLVGHSHSDAVYKTTEYGNQLVIKFPSFAQRAGNLLKNPSQNAYNYNCLTYMTVDKYQKTVRFMRIGADIDTWGVKHNGLSLNYETKELIAAW